MSKSEIQKAKELIEESFLQEKYCVTDNTIKQAIETIFCYIDKLEQENSKQRESMKKMSEYIIDEICTECWKLYSEK